MFCALPPSGFTVHSLPSVIEQLLVYGPEGLSVIKLFAHWLDHLAGAIDNLSIQHSGQDALSCCSSSSGAGSPPRCDVASAAISTLLPLHYPVHDAAPVVQRAVAGEYPGPASSIVSALSLWQKAAVYRGGDEATVAKAAFCFDYTAL